MLALLYNFEVLELKNILLVYLYGLYYILYILILYILFLQNIDSNRGQRFTKAQLQIRVLFVRKE